MDNLNRALDQLGVGRQHAAVKIDVILKPDADIAPIATAAAAIGICMREIPNDAQDAFAGSSSFITFIVSTD